MTVNPSCLTLTFKSKIIQLPIKCLEQNVNKFKSPCPDTQTHTPVRLLYRAVQVLTDADGSARRGITSSRAVHGAGRWVWSIDDGGRSIDCIDSTFSRPPSPSVVNNRPTTVACPTHLSTRWTFCGQVQTESLRLRWEACLYTRLACCDRSSVRLSVCL